MSLRNAPNINALWGSILIEELVRNGVDEFVVAPGSRMWRYLHERGAEVEADHQVLNYWTWVDARDSARAFATADWVSMTGAPV